jgi:hypothetical protein
MPKTTIRLIANDLHYLSQNWPISKISFSSPDFLNLRGLKWGKIEHFANSFTVL